MIKDKSILIKNIYYMLSYVFTTLNQGGYENVATEDFDNLHNLFAAILAKGIGRQLKQGLYREYMNRTETLPVVRGKIDMPGTIQNRLARKQVLTCQYDELSENNLLNQILKTTVMLLLRHARVSEDYKTDLKKEMLFFSNVDTIDPASIRWSSIRFQRNNNTYRMLISLCQLVLEGMLMSTDSGEYRLASFVDEQRMSRLYEKFILEYYAKECPQVKATASQIPWALDDGVGTLLPVMQSDIMLTQGTVAVRVAACWLAGCVARAFAARCVIALYAVHMNIVPALFQNEITEGFCRFCDAPSDARVIADFQVAGFGCRLEFLIMIRAAPAAILHAVLDVPKVYTLM